MEGLDDLKVVYELCDHLNKKNMKYDGPFLATYYINYVIKNKVDNLMNVKQDYTKEISYMLDYLIKAEDLFNKLRGIKEDY